MGIVLDTSFFPDSIGLLSCDCQASNLACPSPAGPPGTQERDLGSLKAAGSHPTEGGWGGGMACVVGGAKEPKNWAYSPATR